MIKKMITKLFTNQIKLRFIITTGVRIDSIIYKTMIKFLSQNYKIEKKKKNNFNIIKNQNYYLFKLNKGFFF